MGARLMFIVLHLVAIALGGWLLFITIPAHLIYAGMIGNRPDTYRHVECKWCKESVHEDATVCPHCRHDLVPYYTQRLRDKAQTRADMRWWQRY
jgi:uncharacterized paraquat-inducible protein A